MPHTRAHEQTLEYQLGDVALDNGPKSGTIKCGKPEESNRIPREECMVRCMLIGMVVLAIGSLPSETLSWDGKQNNMAMEDLARLSDRQLCEETVSVCQRATQPGAGLKMEGLDYLAVIRQAVQKKYGETPSPSWFEPLATAIAKQEASRCTSVPCPGVGAR